MGHFKAKEIAIGGSELKLRRDGFMDSIRVLLRSKFFE